MQSWKSQKNCMLLQRHSNYLLYDSSIHIGAKKKLLRRWWKYFYMQDRSIKGILSISADDIDFEELEKRIESMGLAKEWHLAKS